MTYTAFLAGVVLVALVLRWILFEHYERSEASPSFLMSLLDSSLPSDPRVRWPPGLFVLVVGGAGLVFFQ